MEERRDANTNPLGGRDMGEFNMLSSQMEVHIPLVGKRFTWYYPTVIPRVD